MSSDPLHPDSSRDLEATLPPLAPKANPPSELLPDTNTLRAGATAQPSLRGDAIPVPGAPAAPPGYEILDELGRGGMGVVYRARQAALNRIVALKMMLPGALPAPDDLKRFRIEVQAAARLQHPNVVQVFEIGEVSGCPFYTMEYVHGPSLAARLRSGPLLARTAASCVLAVARAVQHAHDHSILHRDLKPENVLLDAGDRPLLTDFGLAKQLDAETALTRTGAVLGTPSYMAPEQAASRNDLTPATDVYGLGAILYAALTGRPPFLAASALDTILQVLERDPAPPRLLNPTIEPALEAVCLKCLEKNPARRYDSATSLADDLERYLAGEPVGARAVNWAGRLASAIQRSQYDVQFTAYGRLLFAFAAVILLAEAAVTVAVSTRQSVFILPVIHASRLGLLSWLLWRTRPTGLMPSGTAERLMWSVWLAYVTCSVLLAATYRLRVGLAVEAELELYPMLACLTGMAFLTLGSIFWGGCYLCGLAFCALAVLINADLRWGPLAFGLLWAVMLVIIGRRLHRLGANSSDGSIPWGSSNPTSCRLDQRNQ